MICLKDTDELFSYLSFIYESYFMKTWSFSKKKSVSVSLFLWVRSSQNTPKSLSDIHFHLMQILSVFRCTVLWNQFTLLSKSGDNGEYGVWGKRSDVENIQWNWLCRDKPSLLHQALTTFLAYLSLPATTKPSPFL